MNIDHLVINVDKEYQTDQNIMNKINSIGLPYEPKWGKGTIGFKVSNIWIGNEYFEMIRLLRKNGGGWREEWVEQYNNSHRGIICLFIEVDDIKEEFNRLKKIGVKISEPEYLKFKWFFGLLTRTMPWQNSYLPFFQGIPFQLGFQQMKDKKSKNWMLQYMVPNSRENGIEGIIEIKIYGNYSEQDRTLIKNIFPNVLFKNNGIEVELKNGQKLTFLQEENHHVEIYTQCKNKEYINKNVSIHNIKIINAWMKSGATSYNKR